MLEVWKAAGSFKSARYRAVTVKGSFTKGCYISLVVLFVVPVFLVFSLQLRRKSSPDSPLLQAIQQRSNR